MRARSAQLVLALLTLVTAMASPAYAGKPPGPSATLSLPGSALTGSSLTATVTVTPIEAGRPVQLERLAAGAWQVVGSTALPTGGVATLTTNAPSSPATYSYRATLPATRKSAALVSGVSTVSVTRPAPAVTDAPLPVAMLDSPYSFTFTTTDGRPGTWSNVSAAGPYGLSLSSSGVLSGTPTTTPWGDIADFPIQVRFVGDDGQVAYASRTVLVRTPSPVITSGAQLPSGTVGVYYEVHLAKSTPYPAHWALTAGSLPPGLRLDGDGTISNTPTAPTTPGTAAVFTVTVTDQHAVAPGYDTRTFSLVVDPG